MSPGVVILARGSGAVDAAAIAVAAAGAGQTVVLADEGVVVDRRLRALLVAALDRGAGLAAAAALDGLTAQLGSLLAPARIGAAPFAVEAVRVGIAALGDGEIVIDAPAPGAVAIRRADLLRHAPALAGLTADEALVALAVALRREGKCAVRAAGATVERPKRVTPPPSAQFFARLEPLPPRTVRATVLRTIVRSGVAYMDTVAHPRATVVVAGACGDASAVLAAVRATTAPIAEIVWAGPNPPRSVRFASDPAQAFAEAARRRGDRYVVWIDASRPPQRGWLEVCVDELEAGLELGAVVDDGVAVLATREVPYHLPIEIGAEPAATGARLAASIAPAGRATFDRRRGAAVTAVGASAPAPSLGIVYLASGKPGVVRPGLDALLRHLPSAREVVGVALASAEVTLRLLAALPELRLEREQDDPLLGPAVNRALAAMRTDLVVLATDQTVVTPGLEEAVLRAAGRRSDIGAFGIRVAADDPIHGPGDLIPYVDEIAMQRYAATRAARERGVLTEVDVLRFAPLVLDRRALDVVGGFDPAFGATSSGIEDLTLRLRCAGYTLALIEEAFAHRYSDDECRTLLRTPENSAALVRRKYGTDDALEIVRGGFDPARDAVSVRTPGAGTAPPERRRVVICAIGGEAEWAETERFLRRALVTWSVSDPVTVALGLDGELGAAQVAARVRDLAVALGRSLEETPHVRIARVADADWAPVLGTGGAIVAAGERAAFAGCERLREYRPAALRALVHDLAGAGR